ncbi:MAG: hypothetical protein V4459_09175 [Pseudomonadota bacterium]
MNINVPPFPPSIWDWTFDKTAISNWTGLPADALHVLVGMLILVLAAIMLRRPPWHWACWLVVFVAEAANEAYDLLQTHYPADEGNIPASLHDMWLTLLWPTVIVLLFPIWARRSARTDP